MRQCQRLAVILICVSMFVAGRAHAQPEVEIPLASSDFRQIIQRAKDRVFPAVVFIKCIKDTHEQGKKIAQEVSGSGVIMSPDGEVLTNWHVVDKAVEIRCLLSDGTALNAKVVGTDKSTDLALLKLDTKGEKLPCAAMGDSDRIDEGDFVMAMGAPWGMSRSVSIGIVSCTRRYLPDNSEYTLWLQTDAAISPGNSGGPLVNTDGEVIGINSRGIMWGGDMGFAIPSSSIQSIYAQLHEHGRVNWSWLGLQLQPLRDFERNVYFDADDGVIVGGTDAGSPARLAGILPRDRIVSVNSKAVTARVMEDLPEVRCHLGTLPKDEPAVIELVRGADTMTLHVTPREKGKVEGDELDCPRWDLTVKSINQFDNPDLYFHRKEGVFIFGVEMPGNAATARLQRNDILLKIDNKAVATLDDVRAIYDEAIEHIETDHRVVMTVLRNGIMRQVVLAFERDYDRE